MVYCGKPSKGCSDCRAKRTKCDLTRPECGQCRRAGRRCGGYRDQATLRFRDQSNDTASKFHIVGAKAHHPSSAPPASQTHRIGGFSTDLSSTSLELTARQPAGNVSFNSLNVSPEEQAACYFFANYVRDATLTRKGYLEYLPRLFGTKPPDSPLAQIITSLGFAGLANMRDAPEAKAASTYKYASALHGVNAMLRDPAQATTDETLLIILLLSLYETNTGVKTQSIKAWAEHINGAMALIRLRGSDQLKSKVGLRLFYQLRGQILIGSLHRRVAVPENLITWSRLAQTYHDEPVPENQFADILFRINNWRANELSSFTDYRNPLKNCETALNFEAELMEWLIMFHLQYAFTTMPVKSKTDDVFADYYHIYPDIYTAIVWQHYRSTRILVNEIIVTQIAALYYKMTSPSSAPHPSINTSSCRDLSLPPDFPFASNFYTAHTLLSSLTHEICASVPYYLNFHIHGSDWDSPEHLPPAAHANMLLWPMYIVGQLHATSPLMRNWILGRMTKVAHVLGVKQMGMIGDLLKKGEDSLAVLSDPFGERSAMNKKDEN